MTRYIKSIQLTFLCFLFSTLNAVAQKSIFPGNWNYFDNDSIYNEITITERYIYYYSDSGSAERQKIKLTKNSLRFGKEVWTLKTDQNGIIEIQSNKNGVLKLFKLLDLDNALINFYDWSHAKYHNGNGTMMYWRDATERKDSLLVKIKNDK